MASTLLGNVWRSRHQPWDESGPPRSDVLQLADPEEPGRLPLHSSRGSEGILHRLLWHRCMTQGGGKKEPTAADSWYLASNQEDDGVKARQTPPVLQQDISISSPDFRPDRFAQPCSHASIRGQPARSLQPFQCGGKQTAP